MVPVGQVAGVVTCAVVAAVSEQRGVGEVRADLLGRGPEVVERVLLVREDVARWNEDVVCVDTLAAVGEPE